MKLDCQPVNSGFKECCYAKMDRQLSVVFVVLLNPRPTALLSHLLAMLDRASEISLDP